MCCCSDELLECLDALHSARPPRPWLKLSWEAPSLGVWFQGLLQRHDQLHKWLTAGRPRSFWLGGFFNPQVGDGTGKPCRVAHHLRCVWLLCS